MLHNSSCNTHVGHVSLSLVNIKWLNGQETGTFSNTAEFVHCGQCFRAAASYDSVGPSHPCSAEENRQTPAATTTLFPARGPGNEANLYAGHYPSANVVPNPPLQLSSLAVSVVLTLIIEAVEEDWE